MNAAEFRADPELRKYVDDLLKEPRFLLAMQIVKDFGEESDALTTADAIVSVRLLSQAVGRSHFFRDFKALSLPVVLPEEMPAETFGTRHSVDDFDTEANNPTPP